MEERRIVTVLFCDVASSTALAEELDLEEWAEVIAEAFPLLIEPVERLGGTVARLMGDAILAFFGAPVAREDDPQRAILAGLGVLEGLKAFQEEFKRDYGHEFNVRIGINTGEVIVGEFGTNQTFEYTAMGDAVNIAARMEQMAAPGTIQVADPTYRLAQPFFEFESLGTVEVRGKDEPQPAYRVLGRARQRSRYRHGDPQFAPTIGRALEWSRLVSALENLEHGHGGIVSIIGEAGLGKSRLIDELRQAWTSVSRNHDPASWVEHRIASFESDVPHVVIGRWLRDRLDVEGSQSSADLHARFIAELGGIDPAAAASIANTAASLLEVASDSDDRSGTGHDESSADGFREELVDLLDWFWRDWISDCGPGIYVIDDLHWIDPASVGLLEALLDLCQDLPLLLVFAFRPDREALSWQFHRYLTEQFAGRYDALILSPLDRSDSAALIDAMFSGAEFPESLRDQMLDRVSGNPLFAEELARSFIEQGILVRSEGEDAASWNVAAGGSLASIRIPESLQALVQDRIDRIAPEERQTLQLASVVGATFAYVDLEAVSEQRDHLVRHIDNLVSTMLIDPAEQEPLVDYRFYHALIWESVYGSILRRRRRRLHRHVGETLEGQFGERLDERRLALLSRHFAEARDARAVEYSVRAGDRALALHVPEEAVEWYSRAIELAAQLRAPYPEIHVHRARGRALRTIGEYERSREDFHHVLEVARSEGDGPTESRALLDIGESWEGLDYSRAGEWYEAALARSREYGDEVSLALALARVGNWYSNVQRLEEARDALTQALEFYEASDDRRGLADLHNRLGLVATLSGDMEQNRRSRLRAAEISEELEDLVQLSSSLVGLTHSAGAFQVWATAPAPGFTNTHALDSVERSIEAARSARWRSGEAYALAVRSLVRSWRGEYDLALDDAQSALSIASEIEHREWTAVSHLGLGLAHFSLLDYQLAVQAFEEAREVARSSGTPIFVIGADTGLVLARVAGGEYESAREITNRYAERTDLLPISLRSTRYAEALVAQAEGDADRALHLVNELYETAPYLSDPADIPLLARVRGKALADLGDEDAAIEALEAAIRGATADGPRIVAWEAHVDLAELYARANKRERAVQHYDAAIEVLNDIASLIQDSEVRAGFVDRAARLTRESRQDHGIS